MFYYAYEDMGDLTSTTQVPLKELVKAEYPLTVKELQEYLTKAAETRLLPRWVGFWGDDKSVGTVPLGVTREFVTPFDVVSCATAHELYKTVKCLRSPDLAHLLVCASDVVTWAKQIGIPQVYFIDATGSLETIDPVTYHGSKITTLDFFNLKFLFRDVAYSMSTTSLYIRIEIADVSLCYTNTFQLPNIGGVATMQERLPGILQDLEMRYLLSALAQRKLSDAVRERSKCFRVISQELSGNFARAAEWVACPPEGPYRYGDRTPLLYKAVADDLLQNPRSQSDV